MSREVRDAAIAVTAVEGGVLESSNQRNMQRRLGAMLGPPLVAFLIIQATASQLLAQENNVPSQSARSPEIQVVQTKDLTVVTLAGVGPQDQDGKLVGPGDFAAQFKQTWDNVRRLLASAGAVLESIASVNVYTTDAKWQDAFTTLERESFNGWNPATNFSVVQELRTPGALLEVRAVAVIEHRKPPRR